MRVRIRDEMRYISARHCLKGLDLMAYRKKKKNETALGEIF